MITLAQDEQAIQALMALVDTTPLPFEPAGAFVYEDDVLIGGVYGYFTPHWLYVDTLWVSPANRSQNLGTRLMTAVEQAAVRRGIMRAFLGTSDFQARPFYERLGYSVIGSYTLTEQFDNHIMVKQLDHNEEANTTLKVKINPDAEEVEQLQFKLHVHNTEYMEGLDIQPVSLVVLDGERVIGGVQASLMNTLCMVGVVAGEKTLLPSLAQTLENHARENACTHVMWRTDDEAVIQFCRRADYVERCSIPQFPSEQTTVIFEKRL
ncbi:MAG: GNAT family N-acetyltransferase [Chloroflexi bacterium]|nr:GNAT family N-acetyltransferase [Chloroflexota bacterium]